MFNIGPMEFIVISVVAIIFIGPDKLPDALKKFGRFFVQVKRHANDVKGNFDQVMRDAERELEIERIRELQRKLASLSSQQVIDAAIGDTSSKPAASQTPALPESEILDAQEAGSHAHDLHRSADHPDDSHYDPFAQDRLSNKELSHPESTENSVKKT